MRLNLKGSPGSLGIRFIMRMNTLVPVLFPVIMAAATYESTPNRCVNYIKFVLIHIL